MEQPPDGLLAEDARAWGRPRVMLPLFALVGAVGGLFGSFTLGANLLVLAVGGTMIFLAFSGRVPRLAAPDRLPRGLAWWLLPILGLALVELFAFSRNSSEHYPTLSLLADPVLAGYLPRAVAYFAWVTGFWALVRR